MGLNVHKWDRVYELNTDPQTVFPVDALNVTHGILLHKYNISVFVTVVTFGYDRFMF